MQCENCGHTMYIPGQMGSMVQTSGECPNCGAPYRHQPGGENVMPGEMEARGMPAPGEQDMGGNPLQEGIWGSIDGGWKNRMKRDESYASLRTAFDDFDDDDDWSTEGMEGVDLNTLGDSQKLHSRFIVSPEGQVYTGEGLGEPERVFHEDIARHYGLPLDERGTNPLPGYSTGEAWNDGDINFVTHETGFGADQMGQLLQPHYPSHNMPTMMPEHTTFEDRMGIQPVPERTDQPNMTDEDYANKALTTPNPAGRGVGNYPEAQDNLAYQQQKQKAQEAERARGRAYPYYDNPFFNRGGSHNPTREQLYSSWQYEAADFETEQVIEPGPKTEEVDVEGQKNPLILQHDDQEVLDDAKLSLSAHKTAFLPLLLGMGASALAGEAGAGMIGRGLVSGLVRGAINRGAGTPPQAADEMAQPEGQATMPAPFISSIHEALSQSEHPSSIPKLNELEPEEVDPHEHNDGDHGDPIDDYDVSGEGGADDPHGIPLDGPVGQALEDALPALLHFYHSDEAGADDPTIKALIDVLESEHPGTLDEEPSIDDLHKLDTLKTSKLSTGILPVTPQPGTQPGQTLPAPGTQTLQNPVADPSQQVNPVSQASCPQCGARVSPGQGVCPQCGSGINAGGGQPQVPMQQTMQQPPAMGGPFTAGVTDYGAHDEALKSLLARPDLAEHERAALNVAMAMRMNNMMLQNARDRAHQPDMFEGLRNPPAEIPQEADVPPPVSNRGRIAADGGPTNPEQFRMVKEYLIAQGREDLIPDLIDNPGNYADILAEIQGQGDRPQPDPDPGVPPPMPDPTQMGMDPAAMAGGAPPPGMPMTAASDPITPPCPNCGSHTTGMITDDGQAQCSNCNHKWKTDFDLQGEKTPVATKAAADDSMPNPIATPAADQTAQDDPAVDVNPNIWTDQSGQPLQVGQEYEMYSARYDVPDVVRVTSVKPDSLEYVLTGEYGLEHRTAVSRQEAEMDGLTFLPTDQAEPEDMQPPQPAENPMAALSAVDPWGNATQGLNECPQCGAPGFQGRCANCGFAPNSTPPPVRQASWSERLGGKKFSPMEQREFIDEQGTARNSDKLDLAGTHYVDEPQPDDFFIFGW